MSAIVAADDVRALNAGCFCISLDDAALARALERETGVSGFYEQHIAPRTHLFASVPVFLPQADLDAMLRVVGAIEAMADNSAYQAAAFDRAPATARTPAPQRGAFMGYDFHLDGSQPSLIEINTNAGGAYLNAFLARAQLACCAQVEPLKRDGSAGFEAAVLAMFKREWALSRGERPLQRVAIVDENPSAQFLYPEFLLAKQLFIGAGIEAVIADPSELTFQDGALQHQGRPIDLVYNRLTDFALAAHPALRQAWEADAVVLTPNPRNHALYADKRNLTALTDDAALTRLGADAAKREALAAIPRAVAVSADNADQLWERRKSLFFKPVSGYGGKAVYRGDKLTRSTWADILRSDYIAQDLAPPSERLIMVDSAPQTRKVDVRLYTYDGALLLAAARLYQGQTTNFRTEGGGFAPVFFI